MAAVQRGKTPLPDKWGNSLDLVSGTPQGMCPPMMYKASLCCLQIGMDTI